MSSRLLQTSIWTHQGVIDLSKLCKHSFQFTEPTSVNNEEVDSDLQMDLLRDLGFTARVGFSV